MDHESDSINTSTLWCIKHQVLCSSTVHLNVWCISYSNTLLNVTQVTAHAALTTSYRGRIFTKRMCNRFLELVC